MKVTTQRTNKCAKLLTVAGWALLFGSIPLAQAGSGYCGPALAVGAVSWTIGKLSKWWFND